MDPNASDKNSLEFKSSENGGGNQTVNSGKSTPKMGKKKSWVELMRHCDIYDGRWVKDDASSPLYEPGSCPLIDESFDCYRNGRPEHHYLKLRWQPTHCNIPR